MGKRISVEVGVNDLIQATQKAFAGVARPNKSLDKKATKEDVEVLIGKGSKEGKLRVRFFVENGFELIFTLEVAEMFKDIEGYMDGVMKDLAATLSHAKQKRRLEKPIILLN